MRTLEQLDNALKDLEYRIRELENQRFTHSVHGRIQTLMEAQDRFTSDIAEIINTLKKLNVNSRYIEDFGNDEFKLYFENSNLTTSDIKKFIEENITNAEISIAQASNYLNGKIENARARNILGKYLRDNAQKSKKNKQD